MTSNLIGTLRLFQSHVSRCVGGSVRYRHISASKLTIHEFGDPAKVVKKEDFILDLTHLKSHQVLYLSVYIRLIFLIVEITLSFLNPHRF